MKNKKDVNQSSERESGTENFDWIHYQCFPKLLKKFYTQFPLKIWKNIIFYSKSQQINNEGLYYQGTVNKILKKDIFKDFFFREDKNGAIDFKFKLVYKIDYNKLIKKSIAPDFYVYRIEKKKFFELLESRKYMMILKNKNKIPENAKFISILGEIKSSYSSCHIDDDQRNDYEKFINLVQQLETDEYIILMYIYDNSFNFFQKDYYLKPEKESPIIYGYIPKLYYEDCYNNYNELIDQLKLNKEKIKIDINDKSRFKKKRNELEKENDLLTKEINSLRKKYEDLLKLSKKKNTKGLSLLNIFIVFILALIFASLLNYFKFIYRKSVV